MSDLGFVEKLLDGAHVEWIPLGNQNFFDVANRGRKPVKASLRVSGKTPYYGANNVQDFVEGHTHDGEYVLIAEDGSASLENYSIQYVTGKFWANNHVHVVQGTEDLNTRFLFHYLRIVNFSPFLTGGGRAKLTKGRLIEIPVPVPCPKDSKKSLAIQAEIVRILDTFTELKDELNDELEARKKQYNHYRDQLLSFGDGDAALKTLGDVCDFKNGFAFKSSLFRDEGLPIIRIKNVSGGSVNMDDGKYFDPTDYRENTEAYTVKKGDILVAMSGATTGKIGYYAHDFTSYLNQRVGKFLPKASELNSRYLYHFLLSKNQQIYTLAGGGAQPNLSSNNLMSKIGIPIPYPNDPKQSLAEQERIASILDKLDTLTTSPSEGLPCEIALRQQQYEYYRDLLLIFPKPGEAV